MHKCNHLSGEMVPDEIFFMGIDTVAADVVEMETYHKVSTWIVVMTIAIILTRPLGCGTAVGIPPYSHLIIPSS